MTKMTMLIAVSPLVAATIGLTSMAAAQANTNGKAMTWVMKNTYTSSNGKTYAFFASDNGMPGGTNPYSGDTAIKERRSLLCVRPLKSGKAPTDLPIKPVVTNGGADANTWSNKAVMVIPNVLGTSLTSHADADKKCHSVGVLVHNQPGFRMAEFHDGTGNSPGWNFWAEAYPEVSGLAQGTTARYWVSINDQPANPW
jgi:hypothetical protein